MSTYGPADTKAQWFANAYPGSRIKPNVVVLHTTEGTSWNGYGGGSIAPNYTARPDFARKRLDWRAHFPDEMSSRALENHAGGVETNTLNAVQVELVGTCDPAHVHSWGSMRAGRDYIYWPDAPDWALAGVAEFLADQHHRHGLQLEAPSFLAYPASYGNSRVRFSGAKWESFYGVCGHQHVPENDHGDPGAFPIDKVLQLAAGGAARPVPPHHKPRPKPAPKPGPNVRAAAAKLRKALAYANAHHLTKLAAHIRAEIARVLKLKG